MKIILNERVEEVEEKIDILSLVESKGFNPARIVVELNDERVAKREWKDIRLKENDKVEVIRIVSGG